MDGSEDDDNRRRHEPERPAKAHPAFRRASTVGTRSGGGSGKRSNTARTTSVRAPPPFRRNKLLKTGPGAVVGAPKKSTLQNVASPASSDSPVQIAHGADSDMPSVVEVGGEGNPATVIDVDGPGRAAPGPSDGVISRLKALIDSDPTNFPYATTTDEAIMMRLRRLTHRDPSGFPHYIPGPAGSSYTPATSTQEVIAAAATRSEEPGKVRLDICNCAPWHVMLESNNIKPYGDEMMDSNIMVVKNRAIKGDMRKSKLFVRVKSYEVIGKYPSVRLEDPTGTIAATLLLGSNRTDPAVIDVGAVIVLQEVFGVCYHDTARNEGFNINFDSKVDSRDLN